MAERIKIRVVPNAPKSECVGEYGDAIKIKIAAQAMDGKANTELIKFLAKKLGISRNDIEICTGETSRDKLVEISNCTDVRIKLLS
jgi:uncharacterized protein (TIGR00251 family)